jgi:hypothetical protein
MTNSNVRQAAEVLLSQRQWQRTSFSTSPPRLWAMKNIGFSLAAFRVPRSLCQLAKLNAFRNGSSHLPETGA